MSSPNALEKQASRLSRRVAGGAFQRGLLRGGTLCACALGSAALGARVGFGVEVPLVGLLASIGLGAICLGLWEWRRAGFDRGRALAWLDAKSGGSGLLVSLGELGPQNGASTWNERAREALKRVPEVESEATGRRMGALALAMTFAAATVFVPANQAGATPGLRSAAEVYGSELERLREALATLEESVELEPETAEQLNQRLERLEAELADLRAGEMALEGLERLEGDVAREAQRAMEQAAKAVDQLARAGEWAPDSPGAAAREIERALERLAEAGLDAELSPETREALEQLAERMGQPQDSGPGSSGEGLADPQDVQELLEQLAELAELRAKLAEELARLAEQLGDRAGGQELADAADSLSELTREELEQLIEALRSAELSEEQCEAARDGEP